MSFRGHLWTVAPLVRHRLRGPRFLEARPWETALEDPQVGRVRLSGWLREVPGSGEILVLVHGLGGGTES
ncbi:MAG TPA: hypothetical protein VGP73_11515, partial [Thermoanaerobaculia bacterium]